MLALLLLLQSADAPQPAAAGARPTPNVVVVFTDDQGWADVGVQGAQGFATPALDRLAAEGVRFTDFYVSQPVCSASRASLLTGCYADRIGIHNALTPAAKHGIADGEWTMAEMFRERGYRTAAFGKWHLGHHERFLPQQHGFDEYAGIPYSNDMWPRHPESPKAWPELMWFEGSKPTRIIYDQAWFTRTLLWRSEAFIRSSVAEGVPFFLYLPHPMPHVPLYTGPDHTGVAEQGRYGDVIEEIDWTVGRLLALLEELGVGDDTLFVFTSDNGPWLSYGDHAGSTGPLREGKGTTFEGGVRVPFLARWPGRIPAGTVCSEPAMTIDLLPTFAGLVGGKLPEHPIDGLDIWPLMSGEPGARSPHEALYFWYHVNHLEAMRSGKWKLHFPHKYRTMQGRAAGGGGKPGQYDYGAEIGLALFDLQADVGETIDVSAEHPEVVARLTAMADAMRARLGDRLTGVEGSEKREPGRLE